MDKTIKNRNYELICYEDSLETDLETQISIAQKHDCDFIYILHDKDTSDSDDTKILKPHYHLLIFFPNQITISSFKKKFMNYPPHLISTIKDKRKAIQYLIHTNHPQKYQYQISDIEYSERINIEDYFIDQNNKILQESQNIQKIIDIICQPNIIYDKYYKKQILEDILRQGLYSDYRRGYQIFKDLLKD